MPLTFIPNVGQTDRRVLYHVNRPALGLYFTKEEVAYAFQNGSLLAMNFIHANQDVMIEAIDQFSGIANFIFGKNPSTWHTNISMYKAIVYRQLWPGIDLKFDGLDGHLKYEFIVHPGAFQTNHNLGNDVFVSKLDPAGSSLVYSTFVGGSGSNDSGLRIAVDSDGNAR